MLLVLIYGPRQVGKTTLINNYLATTKYKYKLSFGENIQVQEVLSSQNFTKIIDFAKNYELVVIDEAQRIPNIGMGLKILVDQVKELRIIATGSSSFELSGQIGEPLTGRKKSLTLYSLAQLEMLSLYNPYELTQKLEEFLIFGSYPKVLTTEGKAGKTEILGEITHSYLLKDILELEKVKGSKILLDLLRLLAFQIGSEVSLSEISRQIGIDYKTVARYLDLFEKSFVLYNLRGFSRNLRSEVTNK